MSDWSGWPMNEAVYWPKNEKTIGVLSVAPITTGDFISKLVSRIKGKDWHYPRILIDSNSKIPSRGRYFELNETDPSPYILHGIEALHQSGADFVVVPCNTVHILYDKYSPPILCPVPNMIDITIVAALNRNYRKPMIICSNAVRKHELYEKGFALHGIHAVQYPNQDIITQGIYGIKQSDTKKVARVAETVCETLSVIQDIDVIIYGCTDIEMIMRTKGGLNRPYIDSNQVLADFCWDYIEDENVDERIRLFSE